MASEDLLRDGVKRLLAQHASEHAVPATGAGKGSRHAKIPNQPPETSKGLRMNAKSAGKRGRAAFETEISPVSKAAVPSHQKDTASAGTPPAKSAQAVGSIAMATPVAGKSKPLSSDARPKGPRWQPADLTGIERMLKRLADAPRHMAGKCSVAGTNWYEHPDASSVTGGVPTSGPSRGPSNDVPTGLIQRIKDLADRIFAAEVEAYEAKLASSTSADRKWMKTVLSTGTASDRLAAMTLLVQESPLHALRHVDGLLALAKKRGRRESQQAIDALKDLFLSNLLPSSRKLQLFVIRPFLKECDRLKAETLVYWVFEDSLKARYAQLITILQDHLSDAISYFKSNALKTVAELLTEKKEQEAALLSTLVNKLGDPQGKIASKAQFLLSQLVTTHEALKGVVVREVRQFLIRTNLSTQAQYFAVVFLNQITLSSKLKAVAADLISTYFTLFELCSKRGQLDSRLLSAILTGINRAFPYTEGDAAVQHDLEARADTLFQVVHTGSFSASVQALVLLQHVCSRKRAVMEPGTDSLEDRYFRALYSKISLDELLSSGKQTLFLNLVFKSCKSDPDVGRVRAVLKRLAQVALYMPAQFAAGCVFLISEVVKARGDLATLIAGTGTSEGDDTLAGAQEIASTTAAAYDAWKREPKYCGAGNAFLWELLPLALHAHPSVRKFADFALCNPGAALDYRGDPLVDFTLMAFLDRYVYKNPKTKYTPGGNPLADVDVNDELAMGYAIVQGQDPEMLRAAAAGLLHGKSAMQPRGPRHGRADVDEPANRKSFAHKDATHVAPEDLFLHTYFRTKAVQEAGKAKSREDAFDMGAPDDDESVDGFADQLAENLMRSVAGGDADMDDEIDEGWSQASSEVDGVAAGEDEDGFDDTDNDDGEAASGSEGLPGHPAPDQDFSDDDDGFNVADLIADEELEQPDADPAPKSAAKRARTMISSIYAAADDYDAEIDAGEQALNTAGQGEMTAQTKRSKAAQHGPVSKINKKQRFNKS